MDLLWQAAAIAIWALAAARVATRPKHRWTHGRVGQAAAGAVILLGTSTLSGLILPYGAITILLALRWRDRHRDNVGSLPPADSWPGS